MQAIRMLPIDMQRANEFRFARQHIDGYIRAFLKEEDDIKEAVKHGVQLLEDYRWAEYSYTSKNLRMEAVRQLELESIVWEIFIASAYAQVPEMFSHFTSKLANLLGFDDKAQSITTAAEMVAVLCNTNAYDLYQESKYSSWKIVSNIELPEELLHKVERSCYLPPHVSMPAKLQGNRTKLRETCDPESLILNNNHHSGDICLDVLDTMNAVELCLNTEFLSNVEEEPNDPIEDREQQDQWDLFKRQSHEMYKLMVMQGNCFHLLHKVDKRGRIYAQGYHISTQGSSYKKAMLDLKNQHVVTGVPDHLRIK